MTQVTHSAEYVAGMILSVQPKVHCTFFFLLSSVRLTTGHKSKSACCTRDPGELQFLYGFAESDAATETSGSFNDEGSLLPSRLTIALLIWGSGHRSAL